MKQALPALVALAALVAAPAMAADLSVRRAPPPPVFFSWTGCYIGGHLGGLWARKEWTERTPDSPFFGADEGGHNAAGFLGGVQAGCDLQLGGGFVIGIQGDYALSDAQGDHEHAFNIGLANHSRVESLASVTGRVGFAWDRFLGYVKGGGAWESDEYETWFLGEFVSSASESRSGWTVGIGGEYAFTNFLTGFIEYNYYDFGTRERSFFTPDGVFDGTHGIRETKSVLKAGVNVRFGGWGKAPVMAKY